MFVHRGTDALRFAARDRLEGAPLVVQRLLSVGPANREVGGRADDLVEAGAEERSEHRVLAEVSEGVVEHPVDAEELLRVGRLLEGVDEALEAA